MTQEEKVELKKRLVNTGDEEMELVAQKLHKLMQAQARESLLSSQIASFSREYSADIETETDHLSVSTNKRSHEAEQVSNTTQEAYLNPIDLGNTR